MADATDQFRMNVETRVAAEFGAERDAERVADAAVRLRNSEGVEWSPSFVAERMADAPKELSVPEKWNWLLAYVGDDWDFDGGESDGEGIDDDERIADSESKEGSDDDEGFDEYRLDETT